jgi:ribonuclease R
MSTRRKSKRKSGRGSARPQPRRGSAPLRQRILAHFQRAARPHSVAAVAAALGYGNGAGNDALERELAALERDGVLLRNRRGDYCLVAKTDLVRGRVIGHPDGYGFLVPDQGGDDLYLPPREMRSLLNGDRAIVCVAGVDRRGRRQGALVEVLERANREIVGRYYQEAGIGFVRPDNRRIHQDILITPADRTEAGHGQFVVVEIVEQPDKRHQPIGRIVNVLGDHLQAGMAIDVAVHTYGLPYEWPEAALREAAQAPQEVTRDDLHGREDLRQLPLVTIDGEDARDFDDAVCCERRPDGWRLWVAIADVSHYVCPGSALDAEARLRGNSVYFPQHVIPMLPEALSNGICSLNPGVDRLCMVCELRIDRQGSVRQFRFFPGVMRSVARLTYTEVATALGGSPEVLAGGKRKLLPQLAELHALYQALHRRRARAGLLDFSTTENRLIFDRHGRVRDVQMVERNDAHRMIEEFMLAANVAAAQHLHRHRIPCLYRVHETPAAEKLAELRGFLSGLGLSLGGGESPGTRDYARLIDAVHGKPYAHLVETVLLRSLPLAVYSPENKGHFGLNFPLYTHFTSPIRRYPDLLVHRAVRHLLAGRAPREFDHDGEELQVIGDHCSMTERRADEATRDAVHWFKCEYMHDRIGERFTGTVTGVTAFGLFVEIDSVLVEGLVHVTSLPNDYYHFDFAGRRLYGERSGRSYRLADRVKVRLMRVDLDERKIDLEMVDG